MNENEKILRDNFQQAEHRIQNTVCPIYGIDHPGRPYLIGSSIPFRARSRSFLLTAAHVLDENQQTTLYLGGDEEPVQLAGRSSRTKQPLSGRDDDHLDFGFIETSDMAPKLWSRCRFLTPDDLDVDDIPLAHT